jgi:hypothetical protein
MMAELWLADELFLIGHDEYNGKPKINIELLGAGLAGAALAEMLFSGGVELTNGQVGLGPTYRAGNVVANHVLAELRTNGNGHPVQAWIEHLRPDIREVVAFRLVGGGVVRRQTSRSLTGRAQVRFPALDPMGASKSAVRIGYLLGSPQPLDTVTALLAGLTGAIGIPIIVPTLSSGLARDRIAANRAALPPAHRTIVAGVEAVVSSVALSSHG